MGTKIKIIVLANTSLWDDYVYAHPQANLYHLAGWKKVIEKTYGHRTYYLIAYKDSKQLVTNNHQQSISNPKNSINPTNPINHTNQIAGILPIVHLKHFLFGNSLISIPFFDMGGILADNEQTEQALLQEVIKLARELKVQNIELRHRKPLTWLSEFNSINPSNFYPVKSESHLTGATDSITTATQSNKARMLLKLPHSSQVLTKSFIA
nr:hypothetical protein [candidate division KSB1 bacterium]